jgi:serine/threonine-protein kinase HipA
MREVLVKVHNIDAGILTELGDKPAISAYRFRYFDNYNGSPVSLTMPTAGKTFEYDHFPSFFDGVLPEGGQLEGLLRTQKIDRNDYLSQLIAVGHDLIGSVTVFEK